MLVFIVNFLSYLENIRSVSVIGAGNVGWHLAKALHHSGVRIIHVISRTGEHAVNLANQVSSIPLTRIEDVSMEPDAYLLTVKDDALREVAANLAGKEAIVVHTSASTGTDVFNRTTEHFGVFYPLQTFTRGIEMEYDRIPFLIEGSSPKVKERLKDLAKRISGIVHEADSETRLKVHVAAVFACNFNNHLAAVAAELLNDSGLNIELIRPLMQETCRKLSMMDPRTAQTGPAARDDRETMRKHLEALESMPVEQELYKLLSKNILRYRNNRNE